MKLNHEDVHGYRSDVGPVQQNPLVGNCVVDPNALGIGAEVYGEFGPVYAMVGLSDGATTGDFADGRGFVYQGKAGAGFWLLKDQLQLKGECVTQAASDVDPGQYGFGDIDAAIELEFSGVMVEVSANF